jgi:hypothetical protein
MSVRGDNGLIAAEVLASVNGMIEQAEAELANVLRELAEANAQLQALHEELATHRVVDDAPP